MNKYTSNNSKGCVTLHDNYPLAPGKIEIKREMPSECQLKIVDLYNIYYTILYLVPK